MFFRFEISSDNAIIFLSAIATGALGVKAWFQAESAAAATARQNAGSSQITTENHSVAPALDLVFETTWDVSETVELTDAANGGITKVVSNGALHTPGNAEQKTLNKVGLGKVSFTGVVKLYQEDTAWGSLSTPAAADLQAAFSTPHAYTIKITTTNLVRISVSLTANATTGDYVPAYTTSPSPTQITLGTATFSWSSGTTLNVDS